MQGRPRTDLNSSGHVLEVTGSEGGRADVVKDDGDLMKRQNQVFFPKVVKVFLLLLFLVWVVMVEVVVKAVVVAMAGGRGGGAVVWQVSQNSEINHPTLLPELPSRGTYFWQE